MKKIIIFASGSGTNAENIIKYFQKSEKAEVTHVFSNNLKAKVLQRATKLGITALHFDRASFYESRDVLHVVKDANPDLIVLAGFLWKFPENLTELFSDRIINIHPALLPKYGGKGMYGKHVHKAVFDNKEEVSGITIHYVNENYDEGAIIFQAEIVVADAVSPDEIARRIHDLEYEHYPRVIEEVLFSDKQES